ncbi:MAG: hypothetical protein KGL39_00960 [Patescibacteria group bacterium]|nr:hypothetical protein [Patescibacteria group bacterium]
MGSDEEKDIYEEELRRIMDSIDRYNQADPEEVDSDEYERLLNRYEELRCAGYGPQPYRKISN